jgi:pimeloyl-ACP methyl ester carboxylesterase
MQVLDDRDPKVADDGWREWGGTGPVLHLAHANGFPPAAYRALIEPLTARFRVVTSDARPLRPGTDPRSIGSWDPLAEDLAATLDAHGVSEVIGVGHSLGGVLTAFAAGRRSRLFSRLVLVDPVLFSGVRGHLWGWTKRLGWANRLDLVCKARRRHDHWPDLAAVRAGWRSRKLFRRFDEQAFDDFVEAAVREDGAGGLALRYPKEWEARIFETTPHNPWPQLRKLRLPVLVLRGSDSDTLSPGAARRVARRVTGAAVEEVASTTHLLPFERPLEVASTIEIFGCS